MLFYPLTSPGGREIIPQTTQIGKEDMLGLMQTSYR